MRRSTLRWGFLTTTTNTRCGGCGATCSTCTCRRRRPQDWSWHRIESALHAEFGFAPDDVLALGQHFFPDVLARSGYQVSPAAARFVSSLAAASTSAPMWNTPPDGPLHYDAAAQQLSARVPLTDLAVISKLEEIHHDLNAAGAAGRAGPVLPAPGHARALRAAFRRFRHRAAPADRRGGRG